MKISFLLILVLLLFAMLAGESYGESKKKKKKRQVQRKRVAAAVIISQQNKGKQQKAASNQVISQSPDCNSIANQAARKNCLKTREARTKVTKDPKQLWQACFNKKARDCKMNYGTDFNKLDNCIKEGEKACGPKP